MLTRSRQALFSLWAAFAAVAAAQTSTVPLKNVTGLGQSSEHACAMDSSGELYCWGRNDRGQLGDGSVNARTVSAPVVGLGSVTQFAVGGNSENQGVQRFGHTCARTSAGQVKCWGANESGQLGDGTTTDRLTPVAVTGLTEDVKQVVAGGRHTCVVTVGGAAKCWGLNDRGQLGDGTAISRTAPVDVQGLSSGVRMMVAAYKHTCAAMIDGTVKCWGSNGTGELGDGTQIDRATPTNVVGLPAAMPIDSMSAGGDGTVTWGPRTSFVTAPAGSETCVVGNGDAYCWGHGVLNPALRSSGVRSIAAQTGFAILLPTTCCSVLTTRSCAVRSDSSVTCWDFSNGGLSGQPQSMSAPKTLPLSDVAHAVTTGSWPNTCALVGSSAASPGASDHVECETQETRSGVGPLSTVMTTASGLNLQAITFGDPPPTVIANVGDSLTLTILAGGSGNPVILQSTTPSICSVSGSTVTGLAQGKCMVTADQAGNAQYEPAPQVTLVLRVGNLLAQSITFGPPPPIGAGGSGTVTATSTSGLPVSFVSNTPGTCTVSGNVVSAIAAGTCSVVARQGGDLFYAAAPDVTQDFFLGSGNAAAHSLTVGVAFAGRVTSSPAGIDCPSGPCAASLPSGTRVTLTAVAPSPSSGSGGGLVLGGWSGACSGVGPCVLTMDANKAVTARFAQYAGTLVTRFRLYSPTTAEHLYTSDQFEYRYLSNQVDPACCGWAPEGAVYQVMAGRAEIENVNGDGIVDAVPLYRLYNPFSFQHHWTMDLNEYNTLGSLGWSQEGIAQWVFAAEGAGTVPLYRLFLNSQGGLHLWTTDANERDTLVSSAGWTYEGIAAYVIPLP